MAKTKVQADDVGPRKRKFCDEYLHYGFTSIIVSGVEKPQCVICSDILSEESMKPNKLKRHFSTKHPQFADKDKDFFRRKADACKKGRLDSGGLFQQQNIAAVEASYLVALKIAKAKKPHTIAEELLLPCAKDIVRLMIGQEYVKKLQPLSLSNNTVQRRISDMSNDILQQVCDEIKSAR